MHVIVLLKNRNTKLTVKITLQIFQVCNIATITINSCAIYVNANEASLPLCNNYITTEFVH